MHPWEASDIIAVIVSIEFLSAPQGSKGYVVSGRSPWSRVRVPYVITVSCDEEIGGVSIGKHFTTGSQKLSTW